MNNAKQSIDQDGITDKLYFTSDGLAFFDEQNATKHARSLDDITITSKTREEVEREAEEITNEQWDND